MKKLWISPIHTDCRILGEDEKFVDKMKLDDLLLWVVSTASFYIFTSGFVLVFGHGPDYSQIGSKDYFKFQLPDFAKKIDKSAS